MFSFFYKIIKLYDESGACNEIIPESFRHSLFFRDFSDALYSIVISFHITSKKQT